MTRLTSFIGTIYLEFNLVTLSTRVLKEVRVSSDLIRILKGVNMSKFGVLKELDVCDPGVLKGVNFRHTSFGALERELIPVSCEVVC